MRHLNEIEGDKNIQTVFVDFFDTIVHRTVHPNQVLRLWAKLMIRELGLNLKVDELYFIRKDSAQYLSKKKNCYYWEFGYNELIVEMYHRLTSTKKLNNISVEDFTTYFELAESRAEINVQYLNLNTLELLKELKENGYKIYCVSDFYISSKILKGFLNHHEITTIFDDVFVSADYAKSKYSGDLYPCLLEELGLNASSVVMIGDNYRSDVKNAKKHGLSAIHIANKKESKSKRKYLLGSDRKDYRKVLKNLYKCCNSPKVPANSDYILFYSVYIERLYHSLKKEGIKNIFFLAREGLYLKRLFDHYQKHFALDSKKNIKTHYFKTSRQASLLIALKGIDEENYKFLRRKYPDLSLSNFLDNFNLGEDLKSSIINELNFQKIEAEVIPNFLDSEVYKELKTNQIFRDAYNKNRLDQQSAFKTYLNSFNVDFNLEGMHLSDIGWGGSMQECLFDYFEGKVQVHGHYLGLTEIYTIQKDTARWGLNFSVFPYTTFSDNILRGNTELNEQLLSAGHGSTVSYNHLDTFTNEYHHEVEKKAFDDHVFEIQEFMFDRYQKLLHSLDSVCYDHEVVQKEMTDYALRAGLFASNRKVAGALKISTGFYTNVGNFSNGLTMSPEKYTSNKLQLLKRFIISPDTLFPQLLRIKPYLYSKKKYFLVRLVPSWFIYKYIKLNQWVKRTVFQKISRFKYAHLK